MRTALGWVSAVLINVGVLTFIAGLILPRGTSGPAVLIAGVLLCLVGVAIGGIWMLGARAPHP